MNQTSTGQTQRYRHQVSFGSFGTVFDSPRTLVKSRDIADLTDIPKNAQRIFIHDVLETTTLVDGESEMTYDEPCNVDVYFVTRDELIADHWKKNHGFTPVEVSPELTGAWVLRYEPAKRAQAA